MYETVSATEALVGCMMFVLLIGAAGLVKVGIEEAKKNQKKVKQLKERRQT